MDILQGKITKWLCKLPNEYEALSDLSEAEKRGLEPQDIVLLTYPLKIPILRRLP